MKKATNDLDGIIKTLKDIWGERRWQIKNLIAILEVQLNEIRECEYKMEVVKKEVADILNICLEYLTNNLKMTPTQIVRMLIRRAEERYRGNTEEIIKKYKEITNEEGRYKVEVKNKNE